MLILAVLMIGIWVTVAYEKPRALIFAGSIVGVGLLARWVTRNYSKVGEWMLSPAGFPLVVPLEKKQLAVGDSTSPAPADALPVSPFSFAQTSPSQSKKRVMVASRGNPKLLRFAFEYAKAQQAEVWVVFIRYIAVDVGPARPTDVAADNEAQQLNQLAEQIAAEFGVTWRFVYATSNDIADTVLDIAATHAVDVLVLGSTRRGALWKVMKGDVIQKVAELLPESINLLIHA